MTQYVPNPLTHQVAGDHYVNLPYQPASLWAGTQMPGIPASAVKYLTRWRSKGGLADLDKAKHFIEMLIWYHFDHPGASLPIHRHPAIGATKTRAATEEYCRLNRLPPEESAIIRLVVAFDTRDQLIEALEILAQLRRYAVESMQEDLAAAPVTCDLTFEARFNRLQQAVWVAIQRLEECEQQLAQVAADRLEAGRVCERTRRTLGFLRGEVR